MNNRILDLQLPPFDRRLHGSRQPFSCIGGGEIGGKARGLAFIREFLLEEFGQEPVAGLTVDIPAFVVIGTDVFDAFIHRNNLWETAQSDLPDERISHAFLGADLPAEILGDLRAVTEEVRSPLAVRSSSYLEDALFHPFAGVYETKMTPNHQADPQERFQRLAEAVKLVFASTFFAGARRYLGAVNRSIEDEKMAVVLQEVVGRKHHDRFYPTLSGVCRSYNFYAAPGVKPEDGVVDLALGLGKTIVDGGLSYIYSPSRPKAPPPFGSVADALNLTQRSFWAVNVGPLPPYNPAAETEHLAQGDLKAADYDGTLPFVASTYRAESDRLTPGTGADGPRVVNFAPILQLEEFPLNLVLRRLLATCERALEHPVEIEFAMNLPKRREPREAHIGFLQVRPMLVSEEKIEVTEADLARPDLLLASGRVMGNGRVDTIRDVVYVRPGSFDPRHTRAIAAQIEKLNAPLLATDRPYLLIGFGRWGSSDPWLGIPVNWSQIAAARVIVEASTTNLSAEMSQGSHFFHNLTSFQIPYFSVPHESSQGVDWRWLDSRPRVSETEFVRHVRLDQPLLVKVDGRSGSGAIWQRP